MAASARKQGGERAVGVPIAVADAAAEQEDGVVRAMTRRRPEYCDGFFQILAEQHEMMPAGYGVHFSILAGLFWWCVHRMMRLRN